MAENTRAAWRLNRRQFLAGLGTTSLAVATGCTNPGGSGGGGPSGPDLVLPFRRRLDQAIVDIEGWNVRTAVQSGELMLTKRQQSQDAWIVFRFPPQALLEEAFLRSGSSEDEAYEQPPVGSRIANPTRLAFVVPEDAFPLAVTKEALFDWLSFSPSIVPNAVVEPLTPGESDLRAPEPFETAIELPWHLQLSPPAQQGWAHAVDPVTRNDRTELWHTRLGRRDGDAVVEGEHPTRMVRAVWATDNGFEGYVDAETPPPQLNGNSPFRASLTARNRLDIVRLSADFSVTSYAPQPVEIDRLALSGLGGTLDSRFVTKATPQRAGSGGGYTPGPGSEPNSALLQWRHQANLGRDSYVRVVEKGYLFPWGMKSVIITVSDRVFAHPMDNPAAGRGAYLRQRKFIVITDPVRDLRSSPNVAWGGKRSAFRRIECLTTATPAIDQTAYVNEFPVNTVFRIDYGTEPFPFHLRATDWDGEHHDFDAMAVFILDQDHLPYTAADLAPIVDRFNAAVSDPLSAAASPSDLRGQKVSFASAFQNGDTRFATSQMAFAADLPSAGGGEFDGPEDPSTTDVPIGFYEDRNEPRFHPALGAADITFGEVESAGGGGGGQPSTLGYYAGYLQHGLTDKSQPGFETHPNRGQVFLALPESTAPASLSTSTRNTGGLAAPALSVGAVSRMLGPTAAPGDPGATSSGDQGVAQGRFEPSEILDDSVKILGGIVLVKVLETAADFLDASQEDSEKKALRMTSTQESNPDGVRTVIDWEPALTAGPPGLNLFAPLSGASCKIHAEVFTDLADAGASTFDITGDLENFVIILFGGKSDGDPEVPASWASGSSFLTVEVNYVRFSAGANVSDELHCELGDIGFHGPLKFVEKLSELMSFGDGSGIKIDVDGDGILITVTVAIPDLTFGILSLLNMKVIVTLGIPFDGSPVRFGFAFCSRENPFTLRVWIFGGGGFVGVVVTTRGLELLEFSFEFGAGFQLSIGGLASGKVEIAAGIYFKLETVHTTDDNGDPLEQQVLTLEAYIRIDGKVSVLGIITVSIHFHLKLIYTKIGDEELLEGEALVTVEIEVLVFSGSVTLKVRRTISNSSGGSFQGAKSTADGPHFARAPSSTASSDDAPSTPRALMQPAPPDPLLSFVDNYSEAQWNSYADAFA